MSTAHITDHLALVGITVVCGLVGTVILVWGVWCMICDREKY